MGAAVAIAPLRNDPSYGQVLAREFTMVTAENAMKFGPIHPERARYAFTDADAIVDFAQANGMKIRGHALVWHQQVPSWLTDGGFSRDELLTILRDHIMTVAGRFSGKIAAWDVVNEAVEDPSRGGGLRRTVWSNTLGPQYLDMTFRWAREADPQARLFYNEYGGEGLGPKSDAVYALVRESVGRGVPVQGVGLQMHLNLDSPPNVQGIAANIQRLTALGLEVQITELDVRIREPITGDKLAAQARVYRDVAQACMAVQKCAAIILWGFTDRHSWIPGFFPGFGGGSIFDAAYQPKPAYLSLAQALGGR